MNRNFFLILMMMSWFSMLGAQDLDIPIMYENSLGNGLKLVMIPMEGREDMAVSLLLRCGSREEVEPGQEGMASFTASAIFQDLLNRNDSLFNVAGVCATHQSEEDYNSFTLYGPVADEKTMIRALADAFMNATFDKAILNETALIALKSMDSAHPGRDGALESQLRTDLFGMHPYGHSPQGTAGNITQFSTHSKDVKKFFERCYRPENTILFISGGFNRTGEIYEMVKQHFGPWKAGYKPRIIPAYPAQLHENRTSLLSGDDGGCLLSYVWRLPPANRALDLMASLYLMDRALFGEKSELVRYLRNDAGSIESVKRKIFSGRDAGYYAITLDLKSLNDMDFVEQYFQRYMADETPALTQNRLSNISRELQAETTGLKNDPFRLNRALIPYTAISGDAKQVFSILRDCSSRSVYDIRQAENELILPSRAQIYIMNREK